MSFLNTLCNPFIVVDGETKIARLIYLCERIVPTRTYPQVIPYRLPYVLPIVLLLYKPIVLTLQLIHNLLLRIILV